MGSKRRKLRKNKNLDLKRVIGSGLQRSSKKVVEDINIVKGSKKTITKKNKKYVSWEECLIEHLKNREMAVGYINLAIEDEDPRMFLLAVKHVVMAQKGGMTEVAKKTGLNRQNLYRMLSLNGNPSWKSLKVIFDLLGFKLQLVEVQQGNAKKKKAEKKIGNIPSTQSSLKLRLAKQAKTGRAS